MPENTTTHEPAAPTAPNTPDGAKAESGSEGKSGLNELLSKLIMAKMMHEMTGGGLPGMMGHEHGHGVLHLDKDLLEDQIKILGKITKGAYKVTASDRTKLKGVHGLLKGLLRRGGSEPDSNAPIATNERSRKRKSR